VYKFFGIISLLLYSSLSLNAQTPLPIRVNCGSSGYTDSKGEYWKADFGYNAGTMISHIKPATITGTADQGLYQHARLNDNTGVGMIYTFPVPNGAYHVNLYFAEIDADDMREGARVFNVLMQGRPIFTKLDIFAEAGRDAPLIKGTDISVTNGKIQIEFDNVTDKAKVFAIEVLQGNSGPQLTLNFKYPDGTPVVGVLNYSVTSTLLGFSGSEPLVHGQATCALIANPSSLGISMQFTIKASLADNEGHQLWSLNMGMNPSQVNLATVQDSTLTVVVQKM
jgi:hypothetical protein